ncbi:MAG: DUF6174 domain-containing protein [Bacteroidota bacterium]
MKKILYLLAILTGCFLAGCNESERTELEKLEAMHSRWLKLELTDYEYVAGYNCYCGGTGPYTLKFKDGSLDTVYLTDQENHEIDYNTLLELTENLTIETLFERIEENIKRNPHSFNVKYDQKYFFPTEAYFDFDEDIVDEEIGYYVRDFSF